MFTTPLGVRPNEQGEGTSPRDMRHALAGLVASPGVLSGLTVTGRTDWSYAVAAGTYAAQRPENGGIVLGGNDLEELAATDPAPGTGSRIDIIYIQTQEYGTAGFNSSESFVWVAKGMASGTPVAPSLPPGALELARKVVAAGDTNTNAGATITQTATRLSTPAQVDTGWVGPASYGGGYSATNTNVEVRKVGNRVYLRGTVRPNTGTIATGRTGIVLLLPSFATPAKHLRVPVTGWIAGNPVEYAPRAALTIPSGFANLVIDAEATLTGVLLDGITYLTD